MIAAFFDKKYR